MRLRPLSGQRSRSLRQFLTLEKLLPMSKLVPTSPRHCPRDLHMHRRGCGLAPVCVCVRPFVCAFVKSFVCVRVCLGPCRYSYQQMCLSLRHKNKTITSGSRGQRLTRKCATTQYLPRGRTGTSRSFRIWTLGSREAPEARTAETLINAVQNCPTRRPRSVGRTVQCGSLCLW